MRVSRVRVAIRAVHSLAVLVLQGLLRLDMFVKISFPRERRIVPYNSRLLPKPAAKDLSVKQNDKADWTQDAIIMKEGHTYAWSQR